MARSEPRSLGRRTDLDVFLSRASLPRAFKADPGNSWSGHAEQGAKTNRHRQCRGRFRIVAGCGLLRRPGWESALARRGAATAAGAAGSSGRDVIMLPGGKATK